LKQGVLFYGGQKSGKSRFALEYLLKFKGAKKKFVATYDNSYNDEQMKKRVKKHQKERHLKVDTVEESLFLESVVEDEGIYLFDSITIWILNMIEAGKGKKEIKKSVKKLLKRDATLFFVIDVLNMGISPLDSFSRDFIDINGEIGEILAKSCKKRYSIEFGIAREV
jgi:adenosylcobinamide kinase/adenosylcobinamide-phosphate guanylyltransferase